MLFLSQEGDIINTNPNSEYLQEVKDFIVHWQNGAEGIEVHTSGSTGKPKTIKISRKQISASVAQTQEAFNLDKNTLFLCNLHLDYIAGKLMILRALELGAELMVVPPNGDLLAHIGNAFYMLKEKRGHVFLAFVPLQLSKLIEQEKGIHLLNLARATILGGAKTNEALLEKIRTLSTPVFATFGMTETVTHFALQELNGETASEAFSLLKGTAMKVDENGKLFVRNKTTNGQWLETNDLVQIIDSKRFVPLGRADNVINSGGIKLNLEEIELKIDRVLKLKWPFFCYGLQDSNLGSKLSLFIEAESSESNLLDRLKKELPKFEVPKEVICLPKFERTRTGKIDKISTVHAFTVSDQ
ncbi:AMP-binding protein [Marinilongibacter aquaticus]|uniref:AMP-binding protein n=1 Tax=Marinilongibacter aquaticus TaxID=2975157 RepID=UPI0021BD0600|nr:AMP-binding protein [Marinilongibacter aquaticus]UBM59951.1 AMP-binding protein [Marinilongibacter aquaticus]